jgi:lantibiotic modifying enzyme
MFLAAANRVAATGPLAMRALTHSVEYLADASDLTPCAHALSLLRTAYAAAWLVRCGLSDESVLFRLQEAIASIEPSVLREDRHLDVLFGCASGLLASSRAGEVFGWPRLPDCAEVCSETLLAAQQVEGADAGGWRTDAFPDRCITGFSHGAAGIVYALAAAGARDDARVVRAVELGLRFEARCFDGRSGTWRRWRDADDHGVSWCHGAPGIGLARAGMIRVGWDEPAVREDLARAVDAARRHATHTDTFCCGAVGISELFLTAAEVLRSAGLAEDGRAVLARTVLCREPGSYELGTSTNAVCHPGLYQGWSGIAYGLLRSRVSTGPSFALWDLPDPIDGASSTSPVLPPAKAARQRKAEV